LPRVFVRGVDQPHYEEEAHHRGHEVGKGDLPNAALRLAELNKKGLENPHVAPENQPEDGEKTREESEPGAAAPAEPSADASRDALFKDPYKVLAEIAGEAESSGAGASNGDAHAQGTGGPGSDATREFRDPFDPFFAESSKESGGVEVETATASETLRPTLISPSDEEPEDQAGEEVQASGLPHSTPESEPASATLAGPLPMSSAQPAAEQAAFGPLPAPPAEARSEPAGWEKLAAELAEAVKGDAGSHRAPGVAVEQTGEGVMISLTDDADFGMFDIGSAEPQPQLVRIMERVAAILKQQSGSITIRGHTDGRPFRTAAYDNWRLSTDRAQMAYYMLVRGGLDEHRVEAIEGYADRKLKVPADPDASENRRIEILLREVTL
jgi:chemotaxis protein MotB